MQLSAEAKERISKPKIGNGQVSRILTLLSGLFFKYLEQNVSENIKYET